MTQIKFLAILKSIHADSDETWLGRPIYETPLDSLELMMLRSALEASIKHGVSDKLWFESQTLADLLSGLE